MDQDVKTTRRKAIATIGVALGATSVAAFANPDTGTNKGSQLSAGQSLEVNDYLVSPGGKYFAIMQRDGNFCVYRGSGPANQGDFVWGSVQAAGYQPKNGEYFAIMQDDGNFCQYNGTPGQQGPFVWGTVQVGKYEPERGAYFAIMQDDGNFCVYKGGFKFGTIQNPV